MLRWSFLPVLVLLAAVTGCQPAASSPSGKGTDRTEKQTTAKSTEPGGIKPPNPDPGN
jgi:hypothetical protein